MNTDEAPPTAPTATPSRAVRLREALPVGNGPRLYRDPEDRLVAGVCAGVARRVGVDPLVVRVATVALAFAGGVGIVLYLLAWSVAEDEPPGTGPPPPITRRQTLAVGFITLGMLLLLRDIGLWLGDALVVPIVLAAVGSAIIWARADDTDRRRWTSLSSRFPGATDMGRSTPLRILAGVALIAVGIAGTLAANNALLALREVGLALVTTTVGAALAFGPWIARLVGELTEERRERIRTEERAEVAAHLHDSVLQTLALIQRSVDQPRRVVALARSQERELRAWLYARRDPDDTDGTLHALLDGALAEVETTHDLDVELVVVGDGAAAADEDERALVAAVREALTNAGKHAQISTAAVYVEVDDDTVTAFVRDRGRGFDPAAVADDRHGISESIRGRLQRHGGGASVRTAPGEGTEWELTVPRSSTWPDHAADDRPRREHTGTTAPAPRQQGGNL